MPVEQAGTTLSNFNDRCASAGRFFCARVLPYVLLMATAGVLASSVISDPLQAFTDTGVAEAKRTGQGDFTSVEQLSRVALLRRIAADADAVRHLSGDELIALFGQPQLRRAEPEAESWHYTSAECALDIYFPITDGHMNNPAYAEYRVRDVSRPGWADTAWAQMRLNRNAPAGQRRGPDHRACLRSLFVHVQNNPAPRGAVEGWARF